MQIDISELKRKSPLRHLHDSSLKALVEVATTTTHSMNEPLFSAGDRGDSAAFLIYGKVTLESIDGRVICIDHEHTMSEFALSNLKPRMYTATAASNDTVLFWVKDEVLNNMISETLHSQEIDVTDDMSSLANLAYQGA